MSTLYRKYRPQKFIDLVGQDHIRQTLQNQLATNHVAHAYLFTGPRGVGKTTAARLLAKAINCTGRNESESEPCGTCPLCMALQDGRAIDIVEIDAASHTGVDNVRENIIAASRVPAIEGKKKIFIIDEVHMLSTSSFNALLKILEEPPAHVLFVLATTEIHKVPETVISRCQRFDFKTVPHAILVQRLASLAKQENITVSTDVLDRVAVASQGCLRDAESLLGQVMAVGGTDITTNEADIILPRTADNLLVEFVTLLNNRATGDGIMFINRCVEEGVPLIPLAHELIGFLRKLVLLTVVPNMTATTERFSPHAEEALRAMAKTVPLARSQSYLVRFLQTRAELDRADILQIPLELAVIDLCENKEQPPIVPQQKPPQASLPPTPRPQPSAPQKQEPKSPETKSDPQQPSSTRESKQEITSDCALELSVIQKQWGSVSRCVKEKNHSLAAFMRFGNLVSLVESTLTVSFRYPFYRDRVNELKNRRMVEDALTETLGTRIMLNILLEKEEQKSELTETLSIDPNVRQILDAFGGQVVGD